MRDLLRMHDAVRAARDRHRLQTVERARSRIRPVRGVGDQNAFRRTPLFLVIRANHHQTRELTLRTCRRLKRHVIHADDLRERAFETHHELERALHRRLGRIRMKPRKPWKTSRLLIHLRVELHRARAERIKLRVDRKVQLREAHEMANRFGLTHLRQCSSLTTRERTEQRAVIDIGNIERSDRNSRATRRTSFENRSLFELKPPSCLLHGSLSLMCC